MRALVLCVLPLLAMVLGGCANTIDDGAPMVQRKLSREFGHACATENDGFGAIVGKRASDFGIDTGARIRTLVLKCKNGNFSSAHGGAPLKADL